MCRCCIEQMDNLGRFLGHCFRTGIRYQDIRDMASVNHWMDISARHLRIPFPFYGLYLEKKVLEEVTIAYGVLSSGTISIRPMHGLRCLLVKCCKKGLNVTRELDFSTGRIKMFLTWNKSVESRVWILVGYPSSVFNFGFHFSMNSEKTAIFVAILWEGLDSFMFYQFLSGRYHFKTHVCIFLIFSYAILQKMYIACTRFYRETAFLGWSLIDANPTAYNAVWDVSRTYICILWMKQFRMEIVKSVLRWIKR